MFEKRFTEKAVIVLKIAEKSARDLSQSYIGSEHLLYGLIKEDKGIAHKLLLANGLTEDLVMFKIKEIYGSSKGIYTGSVNFTPRTKQIIEMSFIEAKDMGHNYIGTEHLLLALLVAVDSVAGKILISLKIDIEKLKNDIYDMVEMGVLPPHIGENNKQKKNSYTISNDTPILNSFSKDLTKLASDGKLDPVIGRFLEVERVIQILCRRTKNNPCLIGEPGVGKTAIIEGLAQKIIDGDIPDILKNKRVIAVDISSVLAGTKYRGEFEDRLKKAIEEVKRSNNIILFIDELHNIVGAGAAEGAIDAANILKPSLGRGEIQIIGATTIDEYRKHIEKDSALERRFQPVLVSEPTVDDTIKIIDGIKDKYEAHHNVKITDSAIRAAAELSDRYIRDRFLPDKAIDLIDEASATIRLQTHTPPENLKILEEKLLSILKEKEEAIATQDFGRAVVLREDECEIKEQYKNAKNLWNEEKTTCEIMVEVNDIAKVVSNWTGIPITSLKEEEQERLLKMEEILHNRVIGQDEAVKAISKAVRRGKAGLSDPSKPIGSFIFLGPTGVGKTELSKALAEAVFGTEDAIIRVDMSEYMEKHSVSKIVGSPPGYVGFQEGGQLTEKIRRKPYSVILFDEIEKAHPDVLNILLQILDDGILTDSNGRKVNFKNTIIIMTSNIGARLITDEYRSLGFKRDDVTIEEGHNSIKNKVIAELKKAFKPEFLNRIDEIIVFKKLSQEEIEEIVKIIIIKVQNRLKDKGISLSFDESVYKAVALEGYDPVYGARPLKRAIQKRIEDYLSDLVLQGKLSGKEEKLMYFEDNQIKIKNL
jgi:ATP-dependent Clp protease ATP-binding subunit ClpC